MKRQWAAVLLVFLLLCACAALAEETDEALFYTVTYHSNYGSSSEYTKSIDKDPGEAHEIIDSVWGKVGLNFAGWAKTADAEAADYLPGDTYAKDANLDLYAVWAQPYDLGELNAQSTVTIPEFPVANERTYVRFTVAQSDYYRLKTMDGALKNATTFSNYELLVKDGNYWDTIAYGKSIVDKDTWQTLDFSVSAQLEAEETYLLSFICPPDPVKLEIENGISFITYHSNLSGDEYIQRFDKNPGEASRIQDSLWGKVGLNFAGWATSPDAVEADYFPDDLYETDANLDLYAVWMEPYDLGEITAPETVTIPEFVIANQRSYVQFTVSQTDDYRLRTLEQALKNGTSYSSCELLVQDEYGWDSISTGQAIMDEETYWTVDFIVSGYLEAGKTYLLSFYGPPNPVKLEIENRMSFITYHSNYGSSTEYTKKFDKNPDEAHEIIDSAWGKVGLNFAGWATTADAQTADYLPGELYEADKNLDLYAVWAQPYEIGKITGPQTVTIPEFPVANERTYLLFTVSETGFYRLQTIKGALKNATTFSNYELLVKDGTYWDTVAYGQSIFDEETYIPLDFTVTAELKPEETYLLSFICPPDPIKLLCEPQYPPEPYTAKVKLPAGLTVVEEEMFTGATLESVYIPENVQQIAENAFADCENLTKVVIASMDVKIDENAFAGCSELLIVAPEASTAYDFAEAKGYEYRRLVE